MRISSVRVLAALPCVVALSLGGVEPHALRAEEAERAETRSKLQEAKQDPYLEVPAPSSLAGDAMIPTKPLETPTGTYPRPEEVWDRPNAAPSFCFVPRAVSTYYKTGNYLTQDAIDKISIYILDRCGAGTDRMFPTAYLMGMNHSAPAQDLREWLTGNVYYHPENGTRHNTFEAPPPPEGVRLYTTRRNPYEQIVSGYAYELNSHWIATRDDRLWHNLTIWSHDAAVQEIYSDPEIMSRQRHPTMPEAFANFYTWHTTEITRRASSDFQGVLPMPPLETTSLPEYLAILSPRIGLLAVAVQLLYYITPNVAAGHDLVLSRSTPSVSFCENELEEPSKCNDSWDAILEALGITASTERDVLRDDIVGATCNKTTSGHSSAAAHEGYPMPSNPEMIRMLVEIDQRYLGGRIAALNASMDCALSDRYL